MARRLTRAFFDRPPEELAPDLLNKLLVSTRDGERLVARIVEVEAYCGSTDPASHAFRGKTARNTTMFGPPGHLYVYFTYGMHYCANVVAGSPLDDAGAVLLRAAAPVEGLEAMRTRIPRRARTVTSLPDRRGSPPRSVSVGTMTAWIWCGDPLGFATTAPWRRSVPDDRRESGWRPVKGSAHDCGGS